MKKKIFNLIDKTIFSKAIVLIFDAIIFKNDCPIFAYRTVMLRNVSQVCGSKANTIIYKYIYYILLFLPVLIINLFNFFWFIFQNSPGLISQLLLVTVFIIYFIIIILLEYLAYYHFNQYQTIERKFMLYIYYVPYSSKKKYDSEYTARVKFLSEPESYFEFYNVTEIFICWENDIQIHFHHSKEFYNNLDIENEKSLSDFREISCTTKKTTFFNVYAFHHFRYTAAKKLSVNMQLNKYKYYNIFLVIICLISFFIL